MNKTTSFHLAQVNVARVIAPLDDPIMADFVAGLAPINAVADDSPGFVWRLQTENGDATSVRVFEDEMIIVNLSVWETVDDLKNYVYKSRHAHFLRRKKEWFSKIETPHFVMWWVAAGHTPTPAEAKERLEWLAQHGDAPQAFTFRRVFQPPITANTSPS
ncbi:MAG: DUF3291 domain-containing protein [Caldilineaceae bacterium]